MTTTNHDGHTDEHGSLFLRVWLYLLTLTAVEVVLAYLQIFSTSMMLSILVFLSLVKAGLIVAYFMHLRFERRVLFFSLVPAALMVITLLFVFFPDGYRALELRPR